MLVVVIAINDISKVKGQASTLILIGAIMKVIGMLSGYFLQFFIFRISSTQNIGHYYMANGIFNSIANLIFLIGVLMLIQKWAAERYYFPEE